MGTHAVKGPFHIKFDLCAGNQTEPLLTIMSCCNRLPRIFSPGSRALFAKLLPAPRPPSFQRKHSETALNHVQRVKVCCCWRGGPLWPAAAVSRAIFSMPEPIYRPWLQLEGHNLIQLNITMGGLKGVCFCAVTHPHAISAKERRARVQPQRQWLHCRRLCL